MSKQMCPGQDMQHWRPGDIFEIDCPDCGKPVEFFKDEAARTCRSCGARIGNPRLKTGCAQWCAHADACLDR